MNFLFLMDPLENVSYAKDTSFIFMVGACRRGHQVYYLPAGGISMTPDGLVFDVEAVVARLDPAQPFIRGDTLQLVASDVDAVFIRTDPPFDAEYLMNTWLLDHLPPTAVVINEPRGIRSVNEKVWALRFADLVPPSLVTRHPARCRAFLERYGDIIAKPTDGFGGMGVVRVRHGETNANVIFETLSEHGSKELIVQRYISEAGIGDKRILLLGGAYLGAILRVHNRSDHRNNFLVGGEPQATEVTARDRQIIDRLAPELQRLGLHFVGLDILGDCLIEVNVTSPTCLQEINRSLGQQLEDHVITYVEDRIAALR